MPGRKPTPAMPVAFADRYVLEKRLAAGGTAEVWRATDSALGRAVAIKIIHPHLLTDADARARLAREAQSAAALSHPGIVAVYDTAIDEGGAAIVFELVEGGSLADRLRKRGALMPREAARLGAEVAEALAQAHERGVIHRDIKPANILLGPDGEARLVDFGIARLLDEEAAGLTSSGVIVGTLHYLAPEQLRGDVAGPPADIYAVGVLLAELISGQPPYPSTSPVALAEAQQIPPMVIEGAPPELSAIIRAALDPDPAARPASAAELARELRQWLIDDADPNARQPVLADAPTEVAIPVPIPGPPAEPPPAPSPPPAGPVTTVPRPVPHPPLRRRDRRPTVLAAIIGLTLVAVGLLAFTSVLDQPTGLASPPPPTPAPTASPAATPVVTPPPAPTLAEAIASFDALVDAALQNGELDEDAASHLHEAAAGVGAAAADGRRGRLNQAIRDLRRAIGEVAEDDASAETVASLMSAADAIEAAAG